MRFANYNTNVYIGISVRFPSKERLNDMCKAINEKVYRMMIPKCEREKPTQLEPSQPSTYIRSYTYVCHDKWNNETYKARLVIDCIINYANNEYVFSMLIHGANFVVVSLAHEIDNVFTKRVPLAKNIEWDIGWDVG
jgi:predicted dinucleotide-utilizing enzyme